MKRKKSNFVLRDFSFREEDRPQKDGTLSLFFAHFLVVVAKYTTAVISNFLYLENIMAIKRKKQHWRMRKVGHNSEMSSQNGWQENNKELK
jgi:hypothetical protein